jgi:hypothetical protein
MVLLVEIWADTTWLDNEDNEHFESKRVEMLNTRADLDKIVKAFEKKVKRTFAYVTVVTGKGHTLYETAIPGECPEYYDPELTA